ncbi:ABC transporter ATP-binding protein [Achromobacter aloeverae]|uniref:Branched-chain amino acid ABC transporter ATP-binding protein n=1 Tax=Achromobacter aloeverae TaxID=1750518 RepID=A0A4V1MRP9_9BURK|nr:ABC transporter ATP-binding protein [Achromobacter aloeverae]RXN85401.1 branched-chain amino acid ABC transporter ATP-binding protein [Achromobacter aloeverae]
MLSIRDLAGGYGGRPIIQGMNIDVAAGETVAILGANTAGKTTLIKAICGLLPRVQGDIVFKGEALGRLPAHRRVARGIACVPEGRHVFPDMTVHDNLMMGGFHRRREDLAVSLEECYALFPRLRERRAQLAGTLSGGEQQMVALGRALMARPSLLLLDEPSHGLAPMMVDEVHRAISRVNALGIAVLLIEQNVASALKVVTRAYVLESGRIAMRGTASELQSNDEIRRTYLGI